MSLAKVGNKRLKQMLITIDDAFLQLRLERGNDLDDEALVTLCLESAIDVVQNHIGKQMVSDLSDVDQDLIDNDKVIVFSPALRQATLILMTHYFTQSDLVTDEPVRVVPMSYRYILDQFRTPNIGG